MTDIVWKADEYTLQKVAANVVKIREPKAFLGDLPIESIPEYLEYLAIVERIIAGMAIYMEPETDLRNAGRIIEMVETELEQAKKDVREALAALEEKPVIDPGCVDGSGYIDYPEPDQTYGAADD